MQSPLHYSNVALVDPVTKKAVRVAKRFLKDGTKVVALAIQENTQEQRWSESERPRYRLRQHRPKHCI